MPTETDAGLLIRPAEASDAAALARIHITARAAAPIPDVVHSPDDVERWVGGWLAGDDEAWVAEVDETPAAYLRLTATWLDDLYVAPDHARAGIGTALLDLAKARRPDGFCLWVFESNAPARAFYARHGLIALERTDGAANEERAPDIRMAWPGHDPLGFLRELIDEVDAELGDLLARRAALTRAVQPLKPGTGRDPAREAEIVAAVAARATALGPARVARIVEAVITESLDAAR